MTWRKRRVDFTNTRENKKISVTYCNLVVVNILIIMVNDKLMMMVVT